MASPKGGHLETSAAINYRLVVVPIAITVVIFLDDDRVSIVSITMVAVTDNRTLVISVTVMAGADCHTSRSDTNSNLFRARRHCNTNACNGGNYQSVFHRIVLTLLAHAV
jgi:hypothetical protein